MISLFDKSDLAATAKEEGLSFKLTASLNTCLAGMKEMSFKMSSVELLTTKVYFTLLGFSSLT